MSLIKSINEMALLEMPGTQEEMARIANYWLENGHDMSEDELADAVGMDLEQLEYSPEQAEIMVTQIMDAIRGGS